MCLKESKALTYLPHCIVINDAQTHSIFGYDKLLILIGWILTHIGESNCHLLIPVIEELGDNQSIQELPRLHYAENALLVSLARPRF